MKILHLITALDTGGSELMLYKVLSGLERTKFSCFVVSLVAPGIVGDKIRDLNIPVYHLGLSRGSFSPGAFVSLSKMLVKTKPDIIQTWLYHSDLLGLLAAKTTGIGKVVWNVRSSHRKPLHYKRLTAITLKLCAKLSRYPDAVIINSNHGKKYHTHIGYHPKRFEVIPNGFDLDRFKPDDLARKKIRNELGFNDDSFCVGMLARFDPMKDHQTFFQSVKYIYKKDLKIEFVLCGDGIVIDNPQLRGWINEFDINASVHLLGLRNDIPEIIAAMDVVALSSVSEGFPNVIGEAMACSVPCVVTDVGDCSSIVDGTGKVVPPKNPEALAEAILQISLLSNEERNKLGKKARERIRTHYSLDKVVNYYESLYQDIVSV